jgi:hypothetical protein
MFWKQQQGDFIFHHHHDRYCLSLPFIESHSVHMISIAMAKFFCMGLAWEASGVQLTSWISFIGAVAQPLRVTR